MIIYDDQLLVDMELVFNSIRDADGNWQQVEKEMKSLLEAVGSMVEEEE